MRHHTRVLLIISLLIFGGPGCGGLHEVDNTTFIDSVDCGATSFTVDTSWSEEDIVEITLSGSSASKSGSGVSISGSAITITKGGVYRVSGTLDDGSITINSTDSERVVLILNNANITTSSGPAINASNSEYLLLYLAEQTVNSVTDGATYPAAVEDDNSAIHCRDDMIIAGEGSLTVTGRYNDGITSTDGMIILGGDITVNAVDDGIRGKDYLAILGGVFTLTTGGDGMKSDNQEDAGMGFLCIADGEFSITSGNDGIQAQSLLQISGGTFDVTTGGGSTTSIADDVSAKALKGNLKILIDGGTFVLNAADDAVHTNDVIEINDGSLTIASGDDGVHADNSLTVTGGTINITSCVEGMEAADVNLSGGTFTVVSSDDGIQGQSTLTISGGTYDITCGGGSTHTVSSDVSAKAIKAETQLQISGGTFTIDTAEDGIHSDGSVTIIDGTFTISTADDAIHSEAQLVISGGDINITKCYEGIESMDIEISGGTIHLVSSDDGVNGAGDGMGGSLLTISGGTIVVNASGDGIDVNGSVVMTGGLVIVNGPTNDGNGPLDYDQSFNISGGTLIAVGSAGMAQAPSQTSTQNSVLIGFTNSINPGTMLHIEKSTGESLLSFVPVKTVQSLAFSSPDLAMGSSYAIYTGGSDSGTEADGYYTGGVYTPGNLYQSFSVNSTVTSVNILTHPGP